MAKTARIIGKVADVFGDSWDLRERRPTAYGWSVCLGWPHGQPRGRGGTGGPSIIVTRELLGYLESVRETPGTYDLPIGRTAIKRLRRLLGMDWFAENEAWWQERIEELSTMTLQKFAEKYGLSEGAVDLWRLRFFGRQLRPEGWWLKEPARELLGGDYPRTYVAQCLDVSLGTVGRLRWVVRKLN
ncbi:MAG: hypothetical protein WCJ35_03335 [Planctomycetota bacterium]